MNLHQKLAQLRAIDPRRGASFVSDFEATLAEISALNDPASIVPLLDFFDEEPVADEPLFSIVHSIERHPDDVYIRELLRGTPALVRRSPRWSRILYMRVLNSASTLAVLADALRFQAPATKLLIKDLLEDIVKRRPEFAAKVQVVSRSC
jgi:hypothetical protein